MYITGRYGLYNGHIHIHIHIHICIYIYMGIYGNMKHISWGYNEPKFGIGLAESLQETSRIYNLFTRTSRSCSTPHFPFNLWEKLAQQSLGSTPGNHPTIVKVGHDSWPDHLCYGNLWWGFPILRDDTSKNCEVFCESATGYEPPRPGYDPSSTSEGHLRFTAPGPVNFLVIRPRCHNIPTPVTKSHTRPKVLRPWYLSVRKNSWQLGKLVR